MSANNTINLFLRVVKLQSELRSKRITKRRSYHEDYKALFMQFSDIKSIPDSRKILDKLHRRLQKYNNASNTNIFETSQYSRKPDLEKGSEKSFPDEKILEQTARLYNSILGEDEFTIERSFACMADLYLDIIIDEKEFDAFIKIETLLLDSKKQLRCSFSWVSEHLYRKIFTCYFYLGNLENCKIIHTYMYDNLQKRNLQIYEVLDDTERPGIQIDYENLTKKLTANWSFSNLIQAENAFRIKLINIVKFEKTKKRLLNQIDEENRVAGAFSSSGAALKFLNLNIDQPELHSPFSQWPSEKIKLVQPDSYYLNAFGKETTKDLVQQYSEYRLHRLYMEFFNFPERKNEILSEIEYLKVINPSYFKIRTPQIENAINFFSRFQKEHLKNWFKIILDIEHSSTKSLELVYIYHEKRLYDIRKNGIIKNYSQHHEISLLPLHKIETAIADGNYKPTQEEIEFHIWGNEGSQFITNEVLEKLTGSREIRRLSLSNNANLKKLKNVLNNVFKKVEKYFDENVRENEKCFLDHELFLKLLKANIRTKEVDLAKYWFEWYYKVKDKHRVSGQDSWSHKISEEYTRYENLLQELDVCTFIEAKTFARSLKLKNKMEWQKFCEGPNKPENISAKPEKIYKNDGWTNYTDFLGLSLGGKFKSFTDAREFTRNLELKSENDWREYKQSGKKPADIPAKPERDTRMKVGAVLWTGWDTRRFSEKNLELLMKQKNIPGAWH